MVTLCPSILMRPCFLDSGFIESPKLTAATNFFHGGKMRHAFEKVGIERKLVYGEVLQCAISSPYQNPSSRLLASSRISVEETEQLFATSTKVEELKDVSTYLFRTEVGGQVKVSVEKENVKKYVLYIEVSPIQETSRDKRMVLIWGIYRSDSSCIMPLDSQQSASDPGTVETQFFKYSLDKFVLELEFEAKHTPCYVSFALKFLSNTDTEGSEIRNHKKENFCVPVGFGSGHPAPLGLSFPADGSMNFAIFSRNAKGVVLCLYDDKTTDKPALELDLDPYINRSGDVWHASLKSAWNFLSYGYRFKGVVLQEDLDNAECVRLDPYAKIIGIYQESSLAVKYLGLLSNEPAFDWGDDIRPNTAIEKLMVYHLNVVRFTKDKSSQLPSDAAGTFSGLSEKLHHFKDLGVNAILLEPVFPYGENKGPYFPCHFFSPMNLYGPSGGPVSTITAMKEMVRKLHANGIEVLLEVVFTHTAEDGALQGIDDPSYYYADQVAELGSLNALNCNYPIVQRLILDSLRHWVTEYHVDGFVFINASSLLRGFHGEYLSRPPLVEAVAFDPLLSNTKIIADAWDPQNVMQKEVRFPHWKRWSEINTKFCYDVRNYLRGEGLLSNLATRLCGSGDIFSDGRGPAFSFNFISRNIGLPLVDLVSFSGGKLAPQLSWNCGEEGPTNKTAVLETRLKQIRNFLFILYVSLGVPVLNMGDEFGQTSGGSTSYKDRKPFNWNALGTGFAIQIMKFISFLSSFRTKRSDLLQRRDFLKEENIDWHASDQSPPKWEDPSCRFLAMTLKADKEESELSSHSKGDVFVAFNAADHSESVILPPPPEGMAWRRLVDTALPFPGFFSKEGKPVLEQMAGLVTYEMKSHSCILFEASNPSS
ncbi:isoamylase 2 chloroplastic [Tripterygium wilfordii]|uniref:Isoamylase 2 chloroplastic n=1 Tax=Tripterygium wilfordii TaxID=458696 RepID=A0A7J7CEZ2_TRIWF|nr:isoamylase 2, chloroplastic [Tripterygium wilfordii]KAF5732744.1 isoamylase 2 chloroplastic [Tripterygium wilfordii]